MKILTLNKNIYSKKAISLACEAYRDFATILLAELGGNYIILFRKCRYNPETTIKEFENYLIGVENS
jgi:hypothetical protein